MTAEQLLADLTQSGVKLSLGEQPGTVEATPAGVLTDTQRQHIKTHKAELLALLRTQASAPAPAPPEPSESDPDDWLVLDKVYQAHHFHCRQCIAAGKGYGKRCDTGLALWIDYERAAMAAPTPATKRKAT